MLEDFVEGCVELGRAGGFQVSMEPISVTIVNQTIA
jgi:hypothetical protein